MQHSGKASKLRNDGVLIQAVYDGNLPIVAKELRLKDLDLTLKFGGKSFLRHAGERGFKEIARKLIANGANVNEVNGKRNYSLLHSAVAAGNYGFASVLLECGAFPSPEQ